LWAEFQRITKVILWNQFYAVLGQYTPGLVALYRQKAEFGQHIHTERSMKYAVCNVNIKRTVALCALPVYLREEDPQFFKTWNVEESDEPGISDTPAALFTAVTEDTADPVHFSPANISIVVEDDVVMRDIPNLDDAFALFGLIYTLHLDYPKKLFHTFTFIQKILLGLGDGKPLKPSLLSLKNDLLMKE
ncbi:hypothetical protein FQN60_000607, partial [Etheostoma spectabile]